MWSGRSCRSSSARTCSSISSRILRWARNGSSATGSIRRCRGGSPTSLYRAHRQRRRGLSARAAGGGRLPLRASGCWRARSSASSGADRGARARRHSLLQFLGREVRPRPDAAAVLGVHRPVLLSRAACAVGFVDWALAGAFLAGAFWSKYAAFALAATLGLFLLFDPVARRAWRTPGPYVMALAFAIVIAPNVWWLVEHDFLPFHYVDERARTAAHWYQYIVYSAAMDRRARLLTLLPAMALLALLYRHWRSAPRRLLPTRSRRSTAAMSRCWRSGRSWSRRWSRPCSGGSRSRCGAIRCGRSRRSRLLLWLGPVEQPARLRRFRGWLHSPCFIAFPVDLCGGRDRRAVPARPAEGDTVSRPGRWPRRSPAPGARRYGTPLVYVGGTEFAVNNLAVYSPDRPHVLPHGEPTARALGRHERPRPARSGCWSGRRAISSARQEQWRATFGPLDIAAAPRACTPDLEPASRTGPHFLCIRAATALAVAALAWS